MALTLAQIGCIWHGLVIRISRALLIFYTKKKTFPFFPLHVYVYGLTNYIYNIQHGNSHWHFHRQSCLMSWIHRSVHFNQINMTATKLGTMNCFYTFFFIYLYISCLTFVFRVQSPILQSFRLKYVTLIIALSLSRANLEPFRLDQWQ